jgi:hypothetical protein
MTSRACLLFAVGIGMALMVVEVKADHDSDLLELARASWTPLENGNDSSQLLINVRSVPNWQLTNNAKSDRYAMEVLLIPKPHTLDPENKKPIRFDLMEDRFNCREGLASKVKLGRVYEDGTSENRYPWGLATPWRSVTSGTALSSEMKFVCGLQLAAQSPAAVKLGSERIFGTWQLENTWQLESCGQEKSVGCGSTRGNALRASIHGPIAISETQVVFTDEDENRCASNYQIVSRGTGSTFPGGPVAGDKPDNAYTTYVLQFGPHMCAPGVNDITISFPSGQVNSAHFTGFYVQVGTMRRLPNN